MKRQVKYWFAQPEEVAEAAEKWFDLELDHNQAGVVLKLLAEYPDTSKEAAIETALFIYIGYYERKSNNQSVGQSD